MNESKINVLGGFQVRGYQIICHMRNMAVVGSYFSARTSDKSEQMKMIRFLDENDFKFENDLLADGLLKYEYFERNKNKVAIVFDYPENGQNLKDIVDQPGSKSEEEIKRWTYQILRSLTSLQECMLYHNNIRPENCFLYKEAGSNNVKITGLSSQKILTPYEYRIYDDRNTLDIYSPPEHVLSRYRHRTSDVFSLGVMLFYIITKQFPFTNDPNQLNKIYSQSNIIPEIPPETKRLYSSDLINIIDRMLNFNHDKRPTPDELLQIQYFKSLENDDNITYSSVVTRSNNWNCTINDDYGPYHVGEVSDIDNKYEVHWPGPHGQQEKSARYAKNQVELCTRTSPSVGLIPLTVGCAVVRGPSWDETKHGIVDIGGYGTVIRIVSNPPQEYNGVCVVWPSGCKGRYYYGQVNAISTAEVIPAFPPIIPGMSVSTRDGQSGMIISVSQEKNSAKILIKGNITECKYGKDGNFDIDVDPAYHAQCNVQTVEMFCKSANDSSTIDFFDNNQFDNLPVIQNKILERFLSYSRSHEQQIAVGMFVSISPQIKPCLFARVTDISRSDGQAYLKLDAVIYNRIIPIGYHKVTDDIKQCSFGTGQFPPLKLSDFVYDRNSHVPCGTVVFITDYQQTSMNDNNNNIINNTTGTNGQCSWSYVVCQEGQDIFRCYRYDELSTVPI